ncbi:uncharacterized protein ALTATR162_LOCUS4109 [Alternaria atra]|uniref:Uncharacterized protein n=1 Tax=Alternaria atra TaxID=119953 RepID=A0A8J2HXP0_9PLEO|nr:uncharacterized protein ALTATR162_LOCUS4109 [Alternaria atra]CAG5156311.1 unnamed protein product [Alternaria atra]
MSAPIDTEWPYQRNLNIREIEKTPVSLVKTPLQITEPNYEFPEKGDSIVPVETQLHLEWLLTKYELFLAKKRLARMSHSLAPNNLRPTCVEFAYNFPQVYNPRMPSASDQWLVPKPYDPSININTERRQVSSTPTSTTLMAPGTPV